MFFLVSILSKMLAGNWSTIGILIIADFVALLNIKCPNEHYSTWIFPTF